MVDIQEALARDFYPLLPHPQVGNVVFEFTQYWMRIHIKNSCTRTNKQGLIEAVLSISLLYEKAAMIPWGLDAEELRIKRIYWVFTPHFEVKILYKWCASDRGIGAVFVDRRAMSVDPVHLLTRVRSSSAAVAAEGGHSRAGSRLRRDTAASCSTANSEFPASHPITRFASRRIAVLGRGGKQMQ